MWGGDSCPLHNRKTVMMKITPAWRVCVLGVALYAALTICSRNFGDRGGSTFMASLTVAGVVYLLAMREFFAASKFSRGVVVFGLILAAVWSVEFLRVPRVPTMTFIAMFGMAACRSSATILILSFPVILRLKGCILRKPAT